MRKYFRRKWHWWQDYQRARTVWSQTSAHALILFLCLCFWNTYERGEPTTMGLAILGVVAYAIALWNGGQRAADSWLRRNDTFRQTTTTVASTVAEPPVAPLATDKDLE